MIAVKKSNKVKIEWNQKHQSEGCPMITDERLMINEKSKWIWNKHTEMGWRLDFGDC